VQQPESRFYVITSTFFFGKIMRLIFLLNEMTEDQPFDFEKSVNQLSHFQKHLIM
jgi:hypothetical protein